MKRTPMPPRKKAIRPRNRKRAAANHERAYGEYADWIRSKRCLIRSGCYGDVEAAHVKSRGAGGKAEGNLVPLCWMHHVAQHFGGIRTFEKRHGIDLKAAAERLHQLYSTGGPLP